MGKDAGPAPDYQGQQQSDAASSKANVNAQTLANRPNVNTPLSSQAWTQGADGSWQLNAGLTGGLGTAATALGNQAGSSLGQAMDPSLFGSAGTGDQARDQAISSAWGQSTSRLNPQWDQQGEALQSQLAAQGLDPNSQAGRNAAGAFGRDRNDAYTSAMNSAIGQGTSAQAATFGENQQAHQQAIADALTQRNAPLQSLSTLNGFMGTPSFNTAGVADPTQSLNAGKAQGDYAMQQAQMQNQLLGNAIGGLTSMAGSAAMFSDERAKQDIQRFEVEALPGVPFASWEWKGKPGERQFGVIAQDLEKVAPEYVKTDKEGMKWVDYRFLKGR